MSDEHLHADALAFLREVSTREGADAAAEVAKDSQTINPYQCLDLIRLFKPDGVFAIELWTTLVEHASARFAA
jgi:hypothetical protein